MNYLLRMSAAFTEALHHYTHPAWRLRQRLDPVSRSHHPAERFASVRSQR